LPLAAKEPFKKGSLESPKFFGAAACPAKAGQAAVVCGV
jgi:hypothetical protein